MMQVVLDTNCLLVSIGRKSKYRPIFDALLDGKIKLLISNDILRGCLGFGVSRSNAGFFDSDKEVFREIPGYFEEN